MAVVELLNPWHKAIILLTSCMLLCAAIAVISRFVRKRRTARIFFIFFIVFLLSSFATLLVYANKVVDENGGRKELQENVNTIR